MAAGRSEESPTRGASWVRVLLLLPIVAMLWVPFYNSAQPTWMEIPFFYWYQLLWMLISAVITALVYFKTKTRSKGGA
jgi:hypothetical protein